MKLYSKVKTFIPIQDKWVLDLKIYPNYKAYILTIDEESPAKVSKEYLIHKLVLGKLLDVDLVIVEGIPSTVIELMKVLPSVRAMFPTVLHVQGNNPFLMSKLLPFVDGFIVDVKIPLRTSYNKRQARRCRRILGDPYIYTYRDVTHACVSIAQQKALSVFRIIDSKHFLTCDRNYVIDYFMQFNNEFYFT